MWLLQPRPYKDGSLWSRLFFISCWMHGLLLLLLFVVYQGSTGDYHIRIGSSLRDVSVPVVFVPLAKSIKPIQSARKKSGGSISLPKNTATAAIKKIEKKALPKPAQKKEVKKTTRTQSPKPSLVDKKLEVKKPRLKKPAIVPEIKKEQVVESIQKVESGLEDIKVIEGSTDTSMIDDVVYIGQAERDALYMESLIRSEVESKWRPPVGLSKDLVCDIHLEVDWNGKADQIKIVRHSGVLVYDISARSAVKAISFPRAMHGKKFCMNFKQ